LPQQYESNLPTLFGQQQRQEERSFANEREILYQVLFDMKKDMADMKKVIAELMANHHAESQPHPIHTEPTTYYPASTHNPDGFNIVHTPTHQQHIIDANTTVEDTEEYVEESLSLTDAERDMIIRALKKYNGNRRLAAEELNISQRTLYRRINEYGLE
jgi:DNA-binding NtrC family response regulator